MLRSYFLTALRHIRRHRLYAFINIFGLAIGFTAFLLIAIFIKDELSFDRFHNESDKIVKVNLSFGDSPETSRPVPTTPNALLPAFLDRFPEVTGGTRYYNPSSFRPPVVRQGQVKFHEMGFAYADSTFFFFFSFEVISGSPDKALAKPNSVVLTRSAAIKYFGKEDVLDEQLIIYGDNYTVTGLMKDPPRNSHITFSMLASFSSLEASREEVWCCANYFTYIKVNDPEAISSMMPRIAELFNEVGYNSPAEGIYVKATLVPLHDVYLYSEADALSDGSYIVIFGVVAILILALACINYVNLATARSSVRAREVGIRKVSGAYRGQLFGQFISESVVVTLIAFMLSFGLFWITLPFFNMISGKSLLFAQVFSPELIVLLLAIVFLVAFGSGSYPALVLSAFKPASVLKGKGLNGKKAVLLRSGLVVGQFAVSIFFMIATLVIGEQLSFIQNKNLGYKKDAVIAVPVNRELVKSSDAVKNTLLNTGYVQEASFAGETPTQIRGGYSIWGQGMEDGKSMGITAVSVDPDYIDVLGIELVAGDFITETDIRAVEQDEPAYAFVLNESAVKALGWNPQEAVGKRVSMNDRHGEVAGVVADFHFNSLHQPIGPLTFFTEKGGWTYNFLLLRLTAPYSDALSAMEEAWKPLAPDYPFQYSFLDSQLGKLYEAETRLGQVFQSFATIALIIACLGLFGMASFVSLQRTKEFGVRKVLGASGKDIVGLVVMQFVLLVVVAFIIAAPVSYFVLDNWLQEFVYRMSLTPMHFVIGFSAAMLVAVLTISYHAIRSALTNPAEVLKGD